MRALDLVGVDLELRPGIDLRGRREQQAAQRLLRIGLRRARVDHHLAVDDHAAVAARDGASRLASSRCVGAVSDDVHAIDVTLLMADQERVAVELRAGFGELGLEPAARKTAAQGYSFSARCASPSARWRRS